MLTRGQKGRLTEARAVRLVLGFRVSLAGKAYGGRRYEYHCTRRVGEALSYQSLPRPDLPPAQRGLVFSPVGGTGGFPIPTWDGR